VRVGDILDLLGRVRDKDLLPREGEQADDVKRGIQDLCRLVFVGEA
jgi:hypothetical protein